MRMQNHAEDRKGKFAVFFFLFLILSLVKIFILRSSIFYQIHKLSKADEIFTADETSERREKEEEEEEEEE